MNKMLCKDNFKGIGFNSFHDSPWKTYNENIYGWSGIGCKNLFYFDVKKINIDCAGCFDSTRMQYYFLGQQLWDIIDGSNTSPPTDVEAAKKWKVKAGKAMYALTVTIDDEFLQYIKSAKTPKEARDTLATIFTKNNDPRLQRLKMSFCRSLNGI
ncbi:hypothetical protein H5410_005033 [Solanum commersonii]|uniref:Uncharacterized protein n=1 Tax=Solanum commersonii TaxID=4109 RepID=A0A9J6A6Z3_SOLCO|nr:hypothetical protein H5410_005033 [Solanum commersonii]